MKKLMLFSASDCGPCKRVVPMLSQLPNDVIVEKIDIEDDPASAHKHNIRAIPTLIAFSSDVEINRLCGTPNGVKQIIALWS